MVRAISMVNWETFSGDKSQWDRLLLQSRDYIIFQSYCWGELKRIGGWDALRWIAHGVGGSPLAMVQILTRTLPGRITLGWAPGGPVLLAPTVEKEQLSDILTSLVEYGRRNFVRGLVRFSNMAAHEPLASAAYEEIFKRPRHKVNSGRSLWLDLTLSMDELYRRMTSKHRYYVKKASKEAFEWRACNEERSARDFSSLYREMVARKKVSGWSGMGDISKLCRLLEDHACLFTGYRGNVPLSSCLVLLLGQKAFYAMAASGEEGRKLGASYAMMPKLIYHLKSQGITLFDLGGIDPAHASAQGVDHFKKGFGGTSVEYLGEWEWSSSEWLRRGLNLAIKHKLGSQ